MSCVVNACDARECNNRAHRSQQLGVGTCVRQVPLSYTVDQPTNITHPLHTSVLSRPRQSHISRHTNCVTQHTQHHITHMPTGAWCSQPGMLSICRAHVRHVLVHVVRMLSSHPLMVCMFLLICCCKHRYSLNHVAPKPQHSTAQHGTAQHGTQGIQLMTSEQQHSSSTIP
jgi:hypothetical protein